MVNHHKLFFQNTKLLLRNKTTSSEQKKIIQNKILKDHESQRKNDSNKTNIHPKKSQILITKQNYSYKTKTNSLKKKS